MNKINQIPVKKFEEDDTVAFFSRTRGLRIGLVNEIYSDHSDDESDDESEDTLLKPGQIRVEWYPTGKETVANSENVKLIDRVLLMGEIVRPLDNLKKIGFISNVSISCDVMLLPFGQFVLKNVTNPRINFVQKYGDYDNELKYVLYENWVGSVSSVSETLTLRSQRGYRCLISTTDDNFDLADASINRVENSTFDDKQWYEGQTVKCTFGGLQKARWLSDPKAPPESFHRRISAESNANNKAKFVVEKVELETLNVHWISPVVGIEGKMDVPEAAVRGDELKKIKLINRFEHQFVQIGDRIVVDILPSDNIVAFPEWRRMLRDEITGCSEIKGGDLCADESERTEAGCQLHSSLESLNSGSKNESNPVETTPRAIPMDDSEMWSDCESETSEHIEKDLSTKSRKVTASHSNNVTLKWMKKLKSPLKNDRPPMKKRKSSTTDIQKTKTISIDKRIQPGQTCFAETIFVRSSVDIIWQDGTTSENVSTSHLSYAEVELDEHVFFPGSFVLLQEEKERLWPNNGYGVVESIDVDNRIANVSWYEICKNENGFNWPTLTKSDQASIYDLIIHPDFAYTSGCLVMRIENLKVIGEIYVGQVLYTTKTGMLHVQWLSGEYENVYPQEICKLITDEPAWSDEEDNLSDDESAAETDDSWSTVDESNDGGTSDDEEDTQDEAENVDHKNSVCKKHLTFESILQRLKGLPTKIRDAIIELRKINDNDVGPRKKVAKTVLRLYGVLKKMHVKYYSKPLTNHPINDDLKICVTRLKQWLNALNARSGDRRRKDRNCDSLSDDSTTYLDDELDKAAKIETKIRQHIDKAPFQNDSDKHGSRRVKSDGRFGEPFQLFSRLFTQLLSRLLGPRLTRSQRVVDSAQIERLVESLRENNPLFEQFFSSQVDPTVGTPANSDVLLSSDNENAVAASSSNSLLSTCAVDNAFFQRLIDAQRAVDGLESPGFMDLMEFMTSSMSSMMRNKSQLDHIEDAPDAEAVLALIDVTIVSALMIFQLIIINFFELNNPSPSNENGENSDLAKNSDAQSIAVEESTDTDGTKTLVESVSKDSLATAVVESQLFEIMDEPPTSHTYCQEPFDHDAASPKFVKAVRHELKVLQSSLAADIFVKTYERRMDLFSVMIRGAAGTPFVNGLFLFDIRLKPSYPHDPPVVFYRAFASEQLNPNLYQDGKVCVSLLGTWSGKDSEVWNPGSNLLQVLVSIQGLILNAEPYFNEAGYEARRGLVESVEKSRCYNEMALIRSLENLVNIASSPPAPFEKEIYDHMRCRGQGLIEQIRSWMNNDGSCDFPLQPISLGCCLSAKKQLTKLEQLIAQKFT